MDIKLPVLDWAKKYKPEYLTGDITAGITVGIMLIPQGMAYAMLAGLPPIYGLYASIFPLIIYALLGTSRQLAVGPVAMVSLLIASGVGAIAAMGSESFIALAILLALMVGIIQLLLGVFKLGFLVNFLSHPVIAGFTTAAALIIGISQLKHLLGLDIPRGKVHETLLHVFQNFDAINIPTVAIGLGAIAMIITAKQINKKIPSPLIVVVLGVLLVSVFQLHEVGVKIIKDVPGGFPPFSLPMFSMDAVIDLLPIALTISLVSYMESYAVAKAIQAKHKTYNIDPNQELIALGAANIGGSFFQTFPTTGGFSRTAVNDQAGAKTGLAAIISALVVSLTLLFLTSYFYFLPKAVLAAIIMVAVTGLVDIKEAKHLWKTDRVDFVAFVLTAIATLTLGVEPGIGLGVVFSLLLVLYRLAYPHVAVLGRIPNTQTFRNIERFDQLVEDPAVLTVRFDSQLFFANSEIFKNTILKKVKEKPTIQTVVIDASGINNIDSSSVHMLLDLHYELQEKEIEVLFAEVKGPLRDKFHQSEVTEKLGTNRFFLTVAGAHDFLNNKNDSRPEAYVLQSNYSANK